MPWAFSVIEKTSQTFVLCSTKKCREPRTRVRLQSIHSININIPAYQLPTTKLMLLITWEQQKLIVRKKEDKSAQTLCHCFMWCIHPSTKRMHDRMIIWLYPTVCLSRSRDCQQHNSCLLSLSVGLLLLSTGSQEYEVLRCQLKLSRDDKDDNMTSCVMARWHGNQLCQCYIPPIANALIGSM